MNEDDMRQRVDHAFAVDFADRWHSAWNSHDADRVAALCHADIVLLQSSSVDRHGREGVAESVTELSTAFDDYQFESTEEPLLSADGLRVVVPWRLTGTMTGRLQPPGFAPTDTRIEVIGDDHWEFRASQLVSCRVLFDANDLAIQVGAAPPPGSAGERLGVMLQRLAARGMRRRAADRRRLRSAGVAGLVSG